MLDWIVFGSLVVGALAVDFFVSRKGGERNAALWSAVWIGLGVAFSGWIALQRGGDAAITYLTAYAIEKSLSVDNLFAFILIFSITGIPAQFQYRALFWGVLGALVMRAVLIALGVQVLERFHWMIYPLAGFLVYGAVRVLRSPEEVAKSVEKQCSVCTSWVSRIVPISPTLEGSRFVARREGRLMATPLLVALVIIETTDLVFSVESIPAVLALTFDPFLVYSSNIFALLGLRSLYFLVGDAVQRLRFLRAGLAVILLLSAVKLALGSALDIPPLLSLTIVLAVFAASVIASLLFPGKAAIAECTHGREIKDVTPSSTGCEECRAAGDRWIALRLCLSCGNVGCCDSSKNKHATRHFESTGHPVIRSLQPGEAWKWCYVDKLTLP